MNRHERRKAKCIEAKQRRKMLPCIFVDIPAEASHLLRDGDKFTAKGRKMLRDGTLIHDCEQGDETVFTARVGVT